MTTAAGGHSSYENPIHATEYFWKIFSTSHLMTSSSPPLPSLEDLLSPDCRIQNSFSSTSKGLTGIKNCLQKLHEIQNKMISSGLISQSPQEMKLMRNGHEVRFYIKGKVAFVTILIGMALEWQCDIITGIVIMKDMNIQDFYIDNTAFIPPPASVESPTTSSSQISEATILDQPQEQQPQENNEESTSVPVETASYHESTNRGNEEKNDGWYYGKYLGRKRPSSKSTDTSPPLPPPLIFPSNSLPLSTLTHQTLSPPYLCPRPPSIPPMLFLSFHSITNLKSPLTRLIERPVNSYITMQVDPHHILTTPVVKSSCNPLYDPNNVYYLPLHPNYYQLNQSILITIKDKHLLDEDILASCRIPLISLPAEHTNDQFLHLFIPLTTTTNNNNNNNKTRKYGKIYQKIIGNDHYKSSTSVDEESVLTMKVCLLDVERWWYLQENQARELYEIERIENEKQLKLENEIKLKLENDEKEKKLFERYRYGLQPGDEDWIDENKVSSCYRCV